ncbi:MAG: hypothetical protein JW928_09500 [Candidatus Aureabacteria bacterium]|nr:hypothetical protein [Candidatus Auribacterota bacterium]
MLKEEVRELRTLIEEQKVYYEFKIQNLQRRIDELSERGVDEVKKEVDLLRAEADAEIKEDVPQSRALETTFQSGGLSLQALNPEISITGDFIATCKSGDDVTEDFDFNFRGLGIHFESYLDPYSRIKAAVPVSSDGAELGEAYFTRYGVMEGLNLTLGKFRQQFGVVNRWHKHGLDWVDFPLPLRMIFGHGGLNQVGFSMQVNSGFAGSMQEYEIQITDGDNPFLFSSNEKNRPSVLFHLKNYFDVSASTYLEFGLTGMVGWNDTWLIADGTSIEETRSVQAFSLDLTCLWEPTDRMRYRNIEWRTEAYFLNKNIIHPVTSARESLNPWGLYSSLQSKVTRTVDVGLRLDYYQTDDFDYAGDLLTTYPHAVQSEAHRWLTAVYATWHQSPFVKFRLEFDHEQGEAMGADENRIMLQTVVAAGPHKHERY